MRVALVNPTYWPEVRRGTERLIHDLGVSLVGRGHQVTILTAHPGRPGETIEDGLRIVRGWRPPAVPPLTWYEDHVANTPGVIWRLVRGDYDLAHAFHPADAWAAVQARRFGGPPVVFSMHGIPMRQYLVARRYRLEMLRAVVEEAAVCSVLSEAAVAPFRRYLLAGPDILPGGVLWDEFALSPPPARADQPTLLCAASLGDWRKRGDLLINAFQRLRERRPEARLLLVRTPDPFLSPNRGLELADGAEWIEAADTPALAHAYASAWASVLPSIDEAFGLVLLESLAAGTPAVASRSGAGPEIVGDDAVGRLFEPDDEQSLTDALDAALKLGAEDHTRDACRERAREYDWSRVVERYEAVYASAVGWPAD
jgi:glycosyltransferase involved in cell wall biosynthesis